MAKQFFTNESLNTLIDEIKTRINSAVSNKANTSDLSSHTSNKSNPHGVTLAQLGLTATATELNALDGITATVTELNYVDGVTSNIQTQLNGKAASSHTHSAATTSASGFMTKDMVTKLNGIATGANAYTHPTYTARTGVPTANATLTHGGTFTVTQPVCDATGHITALNTRTYTLPSDNNTDTKVTNTLATTTKAYVTGTTSATTNTGTQVFDTGVYLDTTAGKLTATTFNGTTFSGSGVATVSEVKTYLGI